MAFGPLTPRWCMVLAVCWMAVTALPAPVRAQDQGAQQPRPYLGVVLQSLTRWEALMKGLPLSPAIMVVRTMADSPAARAGLQSGDILLEVDGKAVESAGKALGLVAAKPPGTEIKIKLRHKGQEKTVRVELAVKPGEAPAPKTAAADKPAKDKPAQEKPAGDKPATPAAAQPQPPQPPKEDLAQLDARIAGLHQQGKYAEALTLTERYVAAALQAGSKEKAAYAAAINWEGVLYKDLVRYREAEPFLLQALGLRDQELGPRHPATLATAGLLGQLYAAKGLPDKAEEFYRRALEGNQRLTGKEAQQTITTLYNLGMLYAAQGKGKAAEPLYRRALEASERVLGKDHPLTITGVGALAALYQAEGRFGEALPLFRRAFEFKSRTLGKDSPEALNYLANLGECYRRQGRLAEAEPLLKRAFEARELVLGKNHPDTLLSAGHLGVLYKDQGRNEKALPLLRRAAQR
jgi:tetratricopeptide (TPR) repeat protein